MTTKNVKTFIGKRLPFMENKINASKMKISRLITTDGRSFEPVKKG